MKNLSIYILLLIMVGSGLLFLPSKVMAVGNVYYVRTDGSDSNTGLSNDSVHAWLTPQHAASTVAAGDTVNIVTGTYNLTQFTINTSGTAGNPITFQNYGGTVTIDGTGAGITEYGICNVFASYITISGITFRNSSYFGIMADSDSSTRSNIIIQNNIIYNCGSSGIATVTYYDNGVQFGNLTYVTITGNTVHDCNTANNFESISVVGVNHFEVSGNTIYNSNYSGGACIDAKVGCLNGNINNNIIYNSSAPGIYLDARGAETGINIFDNLIYNNTNAGIVLADESGTGSINVNIYNNILYNNFRAFQINNYNAEVITFTFINNTLYNNSSDVGTNQEILVAEYSGNLSSCIIRNNIIYSLANNAYGIWFNNDVGGTNVTVDHNLFYNSGGSWAIDNTLGTNSVIGNPLLVNPTTNFSLQNSSPAIDTGTNTGAPSTDFIGTARPQNIITDIGAYEYYVSNPNSISIIGVEAFQNVFETGDILYFCEYNLAYSLLPLTPDETYSLSLIKPDGNTIVVTRSLFAYGYNIQSIYLTAAEAASIPITWGEGDYLRVAPYPAYLTPIEGVNQATKQLSNSDWISSTSVAANDASNSSFSFYIINLFKRIEIGQGVAAGTYATFGINGNPTLTVAARGILLQAVPFLDSALSGMFVTSLSDIPVSFKDTNSSTNLQTSINTQKILGNTFVTEKANIANWLGISENSAGGLVAFFIMALMFGISFYVIRDIPSAMLMTFVFSIILAGVGLIPINLMFVLVIIAATYMLFLVWRFVF